MLSGSGTNRAPTVDAPLRLEHVRWTYPAGAWELNIPHLSLGNEPICGIIGPNGAGKSTLLWWRAFRFLSTILVSKNGLM